MSTRRSSRSDSDPARSGSQRSGSGRDRKRDTSSDSAQRLRDPRDIRALAHPARIAIIDALASGGTLTATDCASLTGLSPSATAYHLKLLERYQLVEPAAARADGRERPWQATRRHVTVDIDPTSPAAAAATTALILAHIDRSRAVAEAFAGTAHDQPAEWRDVASLATADLWLTAKETETLNAAIAALIDPLRHRTEKACPPHSRRVRVMNMTAPHPR